MQVEASRGPIAELDVQALAVAVFKNEKADSGFLKQVDELSGGLVRSALDAEEFSGKEGETAYFHNPTLQFDLTDVVTKTEKVEVNTEITPIDSTVAVDKKKIRTTVKPNPVTEETSTVGKSKNTSPSPLDNYTVSGLVSFTSTDKVSGEIVNHYMDITKVNDVTDTIYNFITSEYLANNKLTPKEGIDRFKKFAKDKVEFYSQFANEEFEITPEEIILGALPTYEANTERAFDWQQVLDNFEQLKPIVFEKLENSGFKSSLHQQPTDLFNALPSFREQR